MAILESMPGAKVEIIVDGTPVQEYDDDNGPLLSRQITKYIESDLLNPAGHSKSSSVTRSGPSWYERKFTFNALDTGESLAVRVIEGASRLTCM
jgi:hypothetical protein